MKLDFWTKRKNNMSKYLHQIGINSQVLWRGKEVIFLGTQLITANDHVDYPVLIGNKCFFYQPYAIPEYLKVLAKKAIRRTAVERKYLNPVKF